ncbi:MAG: DUF971 domain-containing protein [Gammaproteobacteria bacterium]|nr:DUF971 domain-containing protein [Gammaproteobacteria bacterium]
MNPTKIKLHKSSNTLELTYPLESEVISASTSNEASYTLTAEYLRISSPSAEVRGHSPDQAVLQVGKSKVKLIGIEGVGHYALKLEFDDGHDSGLYTWNYLHDLCINQQRHWEDYLQQLNQAKKSRDPHTSVVQLV